MQSRGSDGTADWAPDALLVDAAAVDRLAEDVGPGALDAVLQAFGDELRRRQPALRAAVDAADLPAVAAVTHAIKGSALTFGAGPLGEWAARANAAAREGAADAAGAAERVLALIDPTLDEVARVAAARRP